MSSPTSFPLLGLCLCRSPLLVRLPSFLCHLSRSWSSPMHSVIPSVHSLNNHIGCFIMKYDSIVHSLELSSNRYPTQQNAEQFAIRVCLLALYFLINYLLCRDFSITLSLTLNMHQALYKYLIINGIWKNHN